jgi:hypothetical protein
VVTAENGTFLFTGVQPGAATVLVRRIGFQADSVAVTLRAEGNTPLTLRLVTVPQALAPVVVRSGPAVRPGPLADFYQRRSKGQGRFITRADIERRNPLYTSDLLRTVPGLSLSRGRGLNEVRLRGAPCAPEVFVDGTPLGPAPLDFDAITPNTIEGIEIYSGAASVPVQFSRVFGRTACGTVLVWTREGEPRPKRKKGKPVTSEELARLVDQLQLYTAEQVDSPAQPPADFASSVRLPAAVGAASAAAGTVAGVIAEFVVDPTGAVEPLTVNIVASPDVAFADAVRAALPGTRFTPAARGGRPVRQLVQLSVRFDPPRGGR